jgi:ribonuclease HI
VGYQLIRGEDLAIPKDHPHWQRMQFKGNKVWLALDDGQRPLQQNGKVLIKYQIDQPHEYWVHPSKVIPLKEDATTTAQKFAPATTQDTEAAASVITPEACTDAICIFTDGACSGNPGPAGIGAVLRYKGNYKEVSRYLGTATNNIAELEAIKIALGMVKNRDLPVIVFTDSSYALGVLSQGWKARENQALIAQLKDLAATFRNLKFIKVRGHAGHPDNERADRLAVQSLKAL